MLCVSVCLGPDYYFTLAVRIARLWYHPAAAIMCCVVVEAQRTKLNTLVYIAKHIIV